MTFYVLHNSGITISGLDAPLLVGQSNANIRCSTNVPADSIVWRNESSSSMLTTNSGVSLTEFTIPLVTDDLQGQQFTCIAVAGDTTYTETVEIQVEGIMTLCSVCSYMYMLL